VRDEIAAHPDLALDVAQNFAPLVIKAQPTRRAGKSLALKMPEQILDGQGPRVTRPPNRLTNPDDLRVRAAIERDLSHVTHARAGAVRPARAGTATGAGPDTSTPPMTGHRCAGWRGRARS